MVNRLLLLAFLGACAYAALVVYQRNTEATVIADTRKRVQKYMDWPGWRDKLIHGETNV